MYAMIAYAKYDCEVQPALYYLRGMHDKNYSPLLIEGQGAGRNSIPIVKYSEIAERFEQELFAVLGKLFDPQIPFTQAEDEATCSRCDYAKLCNRGQQRGNKR
jgi:hypothetical protein